MSLPQNYQNWKELSHFNHHRRVKKVGPRVSSNEAVDMIYQSYLKAENIKKQTKWLWKLLKICHRNNQHQQHLTTLIKIPFQNGPISINQLPSNLLNHDQKMKRGEDDVTQLEFLFDYLKNTKEIYFCWIIYFNQELKVLNVKLCREDQLEEYSELFNPNINLIGLFVQVDKQKEKVENQICLEEVEEFYGMKEGTPFEMAKSTPSNSTGCTWKNTVHLSGYKSKEPQEVKSKSKLRIRSISPKLKVFTCNQKQKVNNSSFQILKVDKARSFLSRLDKNKSNSVLLRPKPAQPHKKYSQQIVNESKSSTFKGRFKKKSKLNLVSTIYRPN